MSCPYKKTGEFINKGTSGAIYVYIDGAGIQYAGKEFHGNRIIDFQREVKALVLSKDCIYVIKPIYIDYSKMVIIYPKYTPLTDYISDPSGIFRSNGDPWKITEFIKKICEGFISLSEKNLVHGDPKIPNMLVDLSDINDPKPVIADLGYCSLAGSFIQSGTFEYLLPEIQIQLKSIHKSQKLQFNSFQTDAYALGILISFLFFNHPQFYFSNIMPIVTGLSNYNPSSRITIQTAYELLIGLKPGHTLSKDDIDAPFRQSSPDNGNISNYFDLLFSEGGPFYHNYNPVLGKYFGLCIFQYDNHQYAAINLKRVIDKIQTVNSKKIPSDFTFVHSRIRTQSLQTHQLLFFVLKKDHSIPASEIQNYAIYLQ